MSKTVVLTVIFIISLAAAVFVSFYDNQQIENKSFEVVPSLFKVVLNQGETINTNLEITNLDGEKNFALKTGNLENIVSLEKKDFTLSNGQSEDVNIYISGLGSDYGAHMGHISVSNGLEEKIIPLIVSIHTPEQFFAINLDVAPENKQVTKKENLVTNIKFFNLHDTDSHTVSVNYSILDINGETVMSQSEEITIGSKSSFTKEFSLPKNLIFGDYVFVVSLNYLGTTTTASYLFSVVDEKQFSFFNTNFLAWIVVVFAGITFLLILYLFYERSTLFSQLKKQQRVQVISLSNRIAEERKKRLAKARTQKQKKKIIYELQDAKRKILVELKRQQKNQQAELRRLKREKDLAAKKKKILQWRKESYPKAVKSAQISSNLKAKLAVLKDAYSEGFIQKESYLRGVSNIESADKKQKTKYL